jgi:hypothetical protein
MLRRCQRPTRRRHERDAQNTAVTAGALGSGALALGAFTLGDAEVVTKVAAGFALGAWVSTLLILMIAAGRAVGAGHDEVAAVNRTINRGIGCAIATAVLAVATLVLAAVFPGGPKYVDLTVVLTPGGQETVSNLCPLIGRKTEIDGKVKENQLGKAVTPVDVRESSCRKTGAADRSITLMLRTADVGGVIRSG